MADTRIPAARVTVTAIAAGLISVVGVLLLVTSFLCLPRVSTSSKRDWLETYLGKAFPFIFRLLWEAPPVYSNDLGDFRIGSARVLSYHRGLVMLAIQDEGWNRQIWDTHAGGSYLPLRGLGIFGAG